MNDHGYSCHYYDEHKAGSDYYELKKERMAHDTTKAKLADTERELAKAQAALDAIKSVLSLT